MVVSCRLATSLVGRSTQGTDRSFHKVRGPAICRLLLFYHLATRGCQDPFTQRAGRTHPREEAMPPQVPGRIDPGVHWPEAGRSVRLGLAWTSVARRPCSLALTASKWPLGPSW